MESKKEIEFNKYKARGNQNWMEMRSRDPRRFNAYQQARYDWILKVAGDVHGKKVLDVGCGGGSLVFLLAKAGAEVVGVENEKLGLQFARENLKSVENANLHYTFEHASAYELPFKDETFDIVVSCEVIEHLREPERMLREVLRVLNPGGKFILTTPYRMTEVPQDENHVKEYFPGEIQVMLEKYFKDVEVKETHHMFWRALFTYGFRFAGKRPLGKWTVNALTLFFGWNPFMIDYPKGKFDLFSSICAWGSK